MFMQKALKHLLTHNKQIIFKMFMYIPIPLQCIYVCIGTMC